jgi:DNA-binding MarR family transcriptional regulator
MAKEPSANPVETRLLSSDVAEEVRHKEPADLASAFESYLASACSLSSSLGESLSQKFGIGLGEWAVLRILSQSDEGLKMMQLAKSAGVSRQRLHQLITPLVAKKLVSVAAAEDDKRGKTVSSGELASSLLADISSDLAQFGKSSTGNPAAASKAFTRSATLNGRLFKELRRQNRLRLASVKAEQEDDLEADIEREDDAARPERKHGKMQRRQRRQERAASAGDAADSLEQTAPQ